MKRKNKLPKYWLGTRMPTSLGYQPNYGIGNTLFTSTSGNSIEPDVQTLKNNTIPNAINKGMLYGSFVTEAFKNTAPILSKSAFRSALFNNPQNAAMFTSGSPVASAEAVANAANTGTKIGLNTAGKAIAGIGAAYGLADMGFQIANNKDHRSAGQMRDTLATNTYTTDLGNTYTTRGGVNRSAELDYARALKLNKNLNFTTTAIGTGAAIGSFFPGAGTAIGAGVGALVGLGANLLGFGDTEEETNKQMNLLTDAVSMENRMAESQALDKDAKQGFYGRTKSGSLGAACGKRPIHARNGKGNAMVSHGEVIGNLNEGWAYREPGVPDNNDTLKRHLNADDFVISNKYGLSNYAASTGDYIGALLMLDMLMNYKNKTGYKCGKLPRLEGGYWNKAFLAIPNLMLSLAAVQLYNKDRNMPVSAPTTTPDYSTARNNLYRAMANLPEMRPIYNEIDNQIYRNIYGLRQLPGLGMGGRALFIDSAQRAGLKQKADAMYQAELNRINNQNAQLQALANVDTHAEDMRVQNYNDWAKRYAQASAAKYNNEAWDLKNIVLPAAQMFGDWWKDNQYEDSKSYKNKMLELINNLVNLDWEKFYADANRGTNTGNINGAYEAFNKLPWQQLNYILGQAARRANKRIIRRNGLTLETA